MLTWICYCRRLRFVPSEVDKIVGVRFFISNLVGLLVVCSWCSNLHALFGRSFGMKHAGLCYRYHVVFVADQCT